MSDIDVRLLLIKFGAYMFQNLPPELVTMFTAMIPVGELRAALPLALEVYHLPIHSSLLWSIAGNIIPVFFILKFLNPTVRLVRRVSICDRFFAWLFKRTRQRFERKYIRYGEIALVLFVAIPLPITGAWTGSVAAFIFGIPFWRAVTFITTGVVLAGIFVLGVDLGIGGAVKLLP